MVSCFPELVELSLSGQSISDQGPVHLRDLKQLETLVLRGCDIGDPAVEIIAAFPRLESLDLYGTHVTDRGVAKLTAMRRLRYLMVRETLVSQEAVNRLSLTVPKLEEDVATCKSTSEVEGIVELARHNATRYRTLDDDILWFRPCGVRLWQPDDWSVIEHFPHLTGIVFDGVPPAAECLIAVTNCRELTRISIRASNVAPDCLKSLAMLPALGEMKLTLDEASDEHLIGCRIVPRSQSSNLIVDLMHFRVLAWQR